MIALAAFAMASGEANGQMFGSEYNIDQFCDDLIVSAANPFRKTVIYIDESMARPESVGAAPSSESDRRTWQNAAVDAINSEEWYEQLEAKLRASLLPSEQVEIVGATSNGAAREISNLCWPGYSEVQLDEIEGASFFQRLMRSDPIDDLETQRQIFFGTIRRNMADAFSESEPDEESSSYVRVLSRDEGRIRSRNGDFVRVILYGHMIEDSEHGSVRESEDVAAMASEAVESTSLRLGDASFYIYGVENDEIEHKARTFWGDFLSAGGAQLAAFGPDLALAGRVPTHLVRTRLDIQMPPPENSRPARATLLIADDGEIMDSALVVAGSFRSALQGTFYCTNMVDVCESQCAWDADMRRSILYEDMDDETISMNGPGSGLTGFIGEPEGKPDSLRAFTSVLASVEGCAQ